MKHQGIQLVCLCAALLMFCALPKVARADLGRDYGESVKALGNKDWKKAESKIRDALAKDPQEKESILISGATRYPYLPYYVLGAALAGQGDCKGAVTAWQESLRQGKVQGAAEHAKLQSGMNACALQLGDQASEQTPAPTTAESITETPTSTPAPTTAQTTAQTTAPTTAQPDSQPVPPPKQAEPARPKPVLVDISAPAAAADRAIKGLVTARDKYMQLANDPLLASEWATAWKPTLDTANREIGELNRRSGEAQKARDRAALEAIELGAQSALGVVQSRQAKAETRIAGLRRGNAERLAQEKEAEQKLKAQQAAEEQRRLAAQQEREAAQKRQDELQQREQLLAAQRELRTELNYVPAMLKESSGNEPVHTARGKLAQAAASAEAKLNSDSITDVEKHTQAIRDSVRRYRQAEQEWQAGQREIALRTPPPELKAIADAYFSGDYQAVVRTTAPEKLPEQREQLQAYLFRSAALFNLYWLGGGKAESLLSRSQADIRAIKKLNGNFKPYIAAFSPNFLKFFQES